MRSKYIYLVYHNESLLSAHTVKHEAHSWAVRSRHELRALALYRMDDGIGTEKLAKPCQRIPWDSTLLDLASRTRDGSDSRQKFLDHLKRAASETEDWPDWAKNLLGGTNVRRED